MSRRAPEVNPADFDQDALVKRTYLTVDEAIAYLGGFPTRQAFRVWATRAGIPKCRAGGLRFLRRDLDVAVQGGRSEVRHERSVARLIRSR
jgi:hypothetical protein